MGVIVQQVFQSGITQVKDSQDSVSSWSDSPEGGLSEEGSLVGMLVGFLSSGVVPSWILTEICPSRRVGHFKAPC